MMGIKIGYPDSGRYRRVYQKCTGEMFYTSEIEKIINVEEDMEGYDVITYICPDCGEEHKSKVYGR